MTEYAAEALAADCDGYVTKPYNVTELVDRTNELYSGHAILRDGSA